MKRRDFVFITSLGTVAAAIPSACSYFGNAAYDKALAQPAALSLIWDQPSIISIGKKYRELIPDEASQRALVRLLEEHAAGIEQKVTEDFHSGNRVLVDGWILSATEARQCALASLEQPNS